MSGPISAAFPYIIFAICLVAVLTDLARGRIYNWLTLPALAAGLIAALVTQGLHGALGSLGGAVLGLVLFGWLFFLGAMGGGDVKLLMALGAWGGVRYVADVALLSVIVGGAMAVVVLATKGRLLDFARRMARFLQSVLIKELEVEAPKIDKKLTMPFGIPIGIAACWLTWADPLARWGIRPW